MRAQRRLLLSVPSRPPALQGHAFGLGIRSTFPLAGVAGAGVPDREVELTLASAGELDHGWSGATETYRNHFSDGRPEITIHHRSGVGYRIWYFRHGRYVVSEDGRTIRCAPPHDTAAPWRLLYAQALPIAAALQGFEVLHASAVVLHGRAYLFVADSGVGKTSLALALVRAGGGFLADDVAAVSGGGERLTVHPGVALANIPPVHGDTAEKKSAEVDRFDEPVRLAGLYFLERGERDAPAAFEAVPSPDPRLLLASTFVFHVATPARLITQLDACARIAREVPVHRLVAGTTLDLGPTADAILTHASYLR